MLRIVSKCSSLDEFVAIFKRFCDDDSIFIVTRTPKEVGAQSRFLITLAGGEPMLAGSGEVVEAYGDPSSPLGRPGMRLRFDDLDENSRATLDALKAARTAAKKTPPPTPILPRIPSKIPAIPKPAARADKDKDNDNDDDESHEAEDAAQAEAEAVADALDKRAGQAPAETRAAGGSTVLPANPFGDLTEESLEAFVECTMYEESGLLEALPDTEAADADSLVPAWWPKDAEEPTKVDGHPVAAEPPYPINSPAAAARMGTVPALNQSAGPVPQGVPQSAPPMAPQPYAPSAPAPRYEPTELVPMYQQRPGWHKTAIVAAIASVLSLGIGYAVWGGGDEDELDQPGPKPTPSATDTDKPATKVPRSALPTYKSAGTTDAPDPTQPKDDKPTDKPGATTDVPPPEPAEPTAPEPTTAAEPAETKAVAPEPPIAAGGACKLSVATRPSGAILRLAGKRIGVSPITTTVPCGPAPLQLNRVRYKPEQRALTLAAGKTTRVRVHFKRPSHTLRVSSVPSGATAYVNGRRIGTTPTSAKVTGYERLRVKLARRGYATWSSKVYARRKVTRVRGKLKRLKRVRRRRR